MTSARLSALDASFLAVETPTAHMHVGWVAVLSAPAEGRLPRFAELRDHIERRLGRAPRYRQKLARNPARLARTGVDRRPRLLGRSSRLPGARPAFRARR